MPRQRASASSKPKASKVGEGQAEGPSAPPEEPNQERGRRKGGVSWAPLCKRLAFFLLIILIPSILNYAVLNQESRMLVPTGGTLYDIGWNQKMLLKCTGQGLPTVLLEAPVGQSSDVWALVEPLVAKKTKVCVYDRAGLGFSDRAYQNTSAFTNDFSDAAFERDRTLPSTVERMVDDLHRLITYASNQPKPILLVGVDFSTFVSRFYAQIYEHEVAGLLLIDPAFEMIFGSKDDEADSGAETERSKGNEAPPLTWHNYWYKTMVPHAQGLWLSSVIGFNRLSLMIGLMSPTEEPSLITLLPKEVLIRKKHLVCQPKHTSSVLYEYYFMNETMKQMKIIYTVKPFPSHLPVTIATYEKAEEINMEPELNKVWIAGQEQLLTSVHPESKHVVIPGSDYLSLYKHPKAIANTILVMVDKWRREAKLVS